MNFPRILLNFPWISSEFPRIFPEFTGPVGISRSHWEIRGNSGKFLGKLVNFGGIEGGILEKFGENWWILGKLGGNSGEIGWKLVNYVSPMVKQNSQTGKSISPTSVKKGEMRENFFTKTPSGGFVWNRWEKWKGNEREFRFHDQFLLHID